MCLRQVFKHYFEELEEESLRDNFVVVVKCLCIYELRSLLVVLIYLGKMLNYFVLGWQYELLDEIMDFGYPQYTEAKILSEFIKTDAYRMEVNQRPPMAVTNAVSWRSEGINYKKNEVAIIKNEDVSFECVVFQSLLAINTFFSFRFSWMWWRVLTYLSIAMGK
jgi:AP-1 complex subunit mu